jgi:hypothetical protein
MGAISPWQLLIGLVVVVAVLVAVAALIIWMVKKMWSA